ncbi:PRC-barrel domain-containing protein [Pseudomonas sp.]|uniref:PRC-barrel domain-containing protein n=1 Tax=Pseudomonas sp. TaxID=306 RepID=UPI003CC61923
MLRSMHDLTHYTLGATDGDIGEVKDVYFDDATWVIRYFVVETGSWLKSRRVLISTQSIQHCDDETRQLTLSITREQVKASPDIDTHKPVSRQHEMDHLGYYGYPYYWGTGGLWNSARADASAPDKVIEPKDNLRLRSGQQVSGYHIQATDGEIGHVDSLLINDASWAVQYLVVNTSNWWVGHKVLIAPEWTEAVSWEEQKVFLDLDRASIQASPAYDEAVALSREHETVLYAHYQRTVYWSVETRTDRSH